jgi:hypothetical protein
MTTRFPCTVGTRHNGSIVQPVAAAGGAAADVQHPQQSVTSGQTGSACRPSSDITTTPSAGRIDIEVSGAEPKQQAGS